MQSPASTINRILELTLCEVEQVQKLGSDVPSNLLWPSDRPLTTGTYRVTIKPGGQQASKMTLSRRDTATAVCLSHCSLNTVKWEYSHHAACFSYLRCKITTNFKFFDAVAEQADGGSWSTTIDIACVDHSGYWKDVSCPCLVLVYAAFAGSKNMPGVAGFNNSARCAAPAFAAHVCIRLRLQHYPKVQGLQACTLALSQAETSLHIASLSRHNCQ